MAIAARVASELTASCGVTFRLDVSARGGRGPTLAAGVDASTGPMLLFLHADTMLPDHFDSLVRGALAQEATLATAFRFRVHRELATPIVGLGTMEATVHNGGDDLPNIYHTFVFKPDRKLGCRPPSYRAKRNMRNVLWGVSWVKIEFSRNFVVPCQSKCTSGNETVPVII